jgi:hypothetical protein
MKLTAPEDIVKEFRDLWRAFEADASSPALEESAATFAANVIATFQTLDTNHLSLFTLEGWQVAKLFNLHHYLGSFGLTLKVKETEFQDYQLFVSVLLEENNTAFKRQTKLSA